MSENETAIRAALLRFYHSDLIAHAGYLLTCTLGAITFVANYGDIREFPPLLGILDQWPMAERIFISFVITGFLFLLMLFLTGVLWWAYMANAIIHLESQEAHPTFHSLQIEAAKYVRRETRTAKEWVSTWSRSSWWCWLAGGSGLWLLLFLASFWVELYLPS